MLPGAAASRRLFHVFDETPAPRLRIKLFGPSRHVGIHNQALSQLPGPTQVEGNVARDPPFGVDWKKTGKMSDTHFSPISTLHLSNLCVPPCSPSMLQLLLNFFSDLFPRRSRRELLKHRTYRLNKVGCRHRSPMPVKDGRESTMPRTPQQL